MTRFYNRTRTTASIPRKLIRKGKPYLLPLYYLLRTSELAREGMDHSGSYRFADHIYAAKAKGRFVIGRPTDAVLLQLKSARALRARYTFSMRELRALVQSGRRLDVLAVPCGLGRELFELANDVGSDKVRLHGLDLDAALIERLRRREPDSGVQFHVGDALSSSDYPGSFDVILSTGLTEFLEDDDVIRFYDIARDRLRSGGRLITSGLDRHPPSDFLLRQLGELHTNYRTEARLRELAGAAGFQAIRSYRDETNLQTMLIAASCDADVVVTSARNQEDHLL